MKRLPCFLTILIAAVFLLAPIARAHFQGLIPSDDMVTKSDSKTVSLDVLFFHPFEGHYMNMEKPAQFGVLVRGRKTDLLGTLREKKVNGFSAWQATYRVKIPGDHIFYVEPRPYWEPGSIR